MTTIDCHIRYVFMSILGECWHGTKAVEGGSNAAGDIDALREAPDRGRPAQLDARQFAAVRAAVLQSPTEHRFGTELWTLKRVGAVIERVHGVRFSKTKTQAWRILVSLDFSPLKPEKRAIERNEDAVRSWKRNT